jgi:hypothetical protein
LLAVAVRDLNKFLESLPTLGDDVGLRLLPRQEQPSSAAEIVD